MWHSSFPHPARVRSLMTQEAPLRRRMVSGEQAEGDDGMPGRDFGPGFAGFDGPGHWVMGLAFMGLSLLFWAGLIALVAWALMRWALPRLRGLPAMAAMQTAQPSAIETLRHRYALGEIDTATFETM